MKKEIFKSTIFCLGAIMLFCSCTQSKFDKAVEILESLPVFFNDERIDQKLTYEDNVITLSFAYRPKTSKWANDVIGEEWVPEYFFRQLLSNHIAAYTIGSTLELKDCVPVDEFLSMAKEKNIKFVIKNGSKEYTYSPDEVKKILSDEKNTNFAAPFFAQQIDAFAKDVNKDLQAVGIYMAYAKMLKSPKGERTICLYFNHTKNQMPGKIHPVIEDALLQYKPIPIYCHLNNVKLAIQYHLVDNEIEITNDEFNDYLSSGLDYKLADDKIFFISSEKLSATWKSFKEKAEQAQK